MAAWATLTGRCPTPWEVSVLRRMDDATRIALAGKKGGTQTLGSVDDATDTEAVKAMFRALGARAANAA